MVLRITSRLFYRVQLYSVLSVNDTTGNVYEFLKSFIRCDNLALNTSRRAVCLYILALFELPITIYFTTTYTGVRIDSLDVLIGTFKLYNIFPRSPDIKVRYISSKSNFKHASLLAPYYLNRSSLSLFTGLTIHMTEGGAESNCKS